LATVTTFPPHNYPKIVSSYMMITDVIRNWLVIYVVEKYMGYDEFCEFVRGI
jgi:hypothetical protein